MMQQHKERSSFSKNNYESPQIEVVEIEIEGSVLAGSVPGFGDDGSI